MKTPFFSRPPVAGRRSACYISGGCFSKQKRSGKKILRGSDDAAVPAAQRAGDRHIGFPKHAEVLSQ